MYCKNLHMMMKIKIRAICCDMVTRSHQCMVLIIKRLCCSYEGTFQGHMSPALHTLKYLPNKSVLCRNSTKNIIKIPFIAK